MSSDQNVKLPFAKCGAKIKNLYSFTFTPSTHL